MAPVRLPGIPLPGSPPSASLLNTLPLPAISLPVAHRPEAEPGWPTAVADPRGTAEPATPGPGWRDHAGWLPLLSMLVILTVQTVLSLRLVGSNTAFTDEALYLWAGHVEWASWLHGSPAPPFATYFSGAPVVYPALGAVADSIGGLAAARILSLLFMLGSTVLLRATASRLYGQVAGFFAAGLWAFLGPTLKLGAFATFDPMSLFLIALATWCAVRATERPEFTRWICASAAALIVANAAAYSTAILDPVVAAVALLANAQAPLARSARMRAAALAAYVVSALVLLIDAGDGSYWSGISQTVLSRPTGASPPLTVLRDAWTWTAPVTAAAAAGLVLCLITERGGPRRALVAVLALAVLLVPLDQARIHTMTSLDKHSDVGAWFAAIAAGYAASAVSRLRVAATWRVLALGAGIAALGLPIATGFVQAWQLSGWANSTSFVTAFRPLAEHTTGPMLVEAPAPVRYYLGPAVPWQRWSNTWAITLPSGRSMRSSSDGVDRAGDPAVYVRLVRRGFFTLVALNSVSTPGLDQKIIAAIGRSHRYKLVAVAPYIASYNSARYQIWELKSGRSAR